MTRRAEQRFAGEGQDLAVVIALALLGLLVALLPAAAWLRAAVLLPLLFVLPGYALAAALFPPRTIDLADRIVYVVALSFAATVLGSILVQLVTELDRVSWTLMLVTVTVLASGAGLARREERPARHPAGAPRLPVTDWLTAATLPVLTLLVAVAIAAAAIGLARQGVEDHGSGAHFTSLSVIPRQYAGKVVSLAIAVHNREGSDSGYLVRLSRSGLPDRNFPIRVPRRSRWRTVVRVGSLSGHGPVGVSLYRDGSLYRRAQIEVGG